MERKITFNDLPQAVEILLEKLGEIQQQLSSIEGQNSEFPHRETWMNLDEAIDYDPCNRTKATWYSMVSRRAVPHHKNGKNLVFLKSEIDEWLKSNKRLSISEIQQQAKKHIQ